MMNRKYIIIFAVIAVCIAGLLFFLMLNRLDKVQLSYLANGEILESGEGSIVVSGIVMSKDPQDSRKVKKTVEFLITPETILKNTVLVITKEQIESQKEFKPATEQRPGNISDFVAKPRIISIQADADLFNLDKATAFEIEYSTYDFPAF